MLETRILKSPDDLSDAFFVREEVFTREQGFAAPDTDDKEEQSLHVVLYQDGRPIATGRTYPGEEGVYHIGRICVLKEFRKLHLGKRLMDELERLAAAQGAGLLVLGAQLYAVPFYEKCGFTPTGERYMDEFCEHEYLQKRL